jgi:hypothetical protein
MEPTAKYEYDYSPVTLSIQTLGGISTPLIRRGTPLPYDTTQVFSTAADNQKSVEINILLGERPLAKYNISIGKCLLNNVAPAKSGEPQISVIFAVDKLYNVKVVALETKSAARVEAKFERSQIKLTDALVRKLTSDAQIHKIRDDAESTIAEANLRVQKDLRNNMVTSITTKIEQLISVLGIALMEDDPFIGEKTQQLRGLLETSSGGSSPFGSGGFGSVFETFFSPTSSVKQKKPITKQPVSQSQVQTPKESTTPVSTPSTNITVLIQSFLEQVSPDLESKRLGAWQALESGTQDGPAQAAHSMREVLRQILDNLAAIAAVQKAPWYKKPKENSPVTRAMRIRYAITGTSDVESESTLSLINGISEAVNAMYSKLSAESHSETRLKISKVRMYLFACEAIIGLIATERKP